jgi:UDP-N-acetylmuramoyl-L-alanyl-D-glutamate--2,6-diaminopimelate ligase
MKLKLQTLIEFLSSGKTPLLSPFNDNSSQINFPPGAELKEQIVTQIDFDSRQVKSGSVFFCIKGEKNDGHNFIQKAIQSGAICIVADIQRKSELEKEISSIQGKDFLLVFSSNIRKAMASASDLFSGKPSCQTSLIGVTGTNGKTTTTHLIAQVLSQNINHRIGLIGTLGSKIYEKGKMIEFLGEGSGRTTPEAPELQNQISEIVNRGCSHAAMEVSSHSLEQNRVYGCHFMQAVFTNLTQDHLDYHVTMENYFQAKVILFDFLSEQAEEDLEHPNEYSAIINLDSEWSLRLIERMSPKIKLITFGINNVQASINATNVKSGLWGIEADINSASGSGTLKLPLHGLFNLYNALAALGVARGNKIDFQDCLDSLAKCEAAPGRFQVVENPNSHSGHSALNSLEDHVSEPKSNDPLCIVDYAHTPDGLENVLKTAREIVPAGGKLLCVFGCGGDRDATKRPIMGRIATSLSDFTMITSDNPRSEEPNQIVSDILSGIHSLGNVEVEIDRAAAIRRAIEKANSNDIVLIAGKGHETYQILGDTTIHFDDCEEVRKVLSNDFP